MLTFLLARQNQGSSNCLY